MSPTSYQTAPPREGMIAEAEWFVKLAVQITEQRRLIAQSERMRFGDLARAKFFETASKIFRVDSRRIANGSIILIITEQELFRFTLSAKRAVDPFLHSAGNHGTPQLLCGGFFDFPNL
jgi:hypothetical protein